MHISSFSLSGIPFLSGTEFSPWDNFRHNPILNHQQHCRYHPTHHYELNLPHLIVSPQDEVRCSHLKDSGRTRASTLGRSQPTTARVGRARAAAPLASGPRATISASGPPGLRPHPPLVRCLGFGILVTFQSPAFAPGRPRFLPARQFTVVDVKYSCQKIDKNIVRRRESIRGHRTVIPLIVDRSSLKFLRAGWRSVWQL